jgi:NCS1 nucleoside transporter family
MSTAVDIKKGASKGSSEDEKYGYRVPSEPLSGEVIAVQQARPKTLQKLVNFMRRLGGEERGIERVLPHEKTNQKPFDNFSVWYGLLFDILTLRMSANLSVSTFSLGTLGPQLFFMGWWDSFFTILLFNILGMIPPAYMATFGPKTGLRTIAFTRFTFGWYGAIVLAVVNIISAIGWSMVNSIVGGQVILAVSDGKCPIPVGVILIAIISLIVSLFGYNIIHQYERYSWILMLIIFCIVAALGAHSFVNIPMPSGKGEMASVLSFGAAVFGFSVAWCSFTMDYNVNMKADIPAWKPFTWTYLGLFISLNLIEWLGAAAMTAAVVDSEWSAAYEASGIGGLLEMCVQQAGGFGQFCLVLLAFSIVANNIPNNYSLGLSAQVLGNWALKIPRFVWTFVGVVVYVILAVAGREHFAQILDSFLLCIGYWATPYAMIIFMEHIVFKRGVYNLDTWNNKKGLPIGAAAFIAWAVSIVMAVMGMSQEWYVGPIAQAAGGAPYGADIGFELSIATSLVVYLPLRYLEKKKFGR